MRRRWHGLTRGHSKRRHRRHGVSRNRLHRVTNIVPLPRQRSKALDKWWKVLRSWEHRYAIVLPSSEPWWQRRRQKCREWLRVVLRSGRRCRWNIMTNRRHGESLSLSQETKLTLYTFFSGTAGAPGPCHVMQQPSRSSKCSVRQTSHACSSNACDVFSIMSP